ncbi:hypothetical protein EYF80_047348 [Liparis tanakae]|uniref:Uncharacterized protein n=1 Tax=Liparis tanakae TaxID=230148 RepID=A0A4Z2FNQ8_9TELE|nr:hypothetical protein EYF80_047348 [Liparis tanakae]
MRLEERHRHQQGADDDGQHSGGDGARDQTHALRLGCGAERREERRSAGKSVSSRFVRHSER